MAAGWLKLRRSSDRHARLAAALPTGPPALKRSPVSLKRLFSARSVPSSAYSLRYTHRCSMDDAVASAVSVTPSPSGSTGTNTPPLGLDTARRGLDGRRQLLLPQPQLGR